VIDTLKFAETLEELGEMPRAQARAFAHAFAAATSQDLATKEDLRLLRAELRGEMEVLRGEMRSLRAELKGEMAALRAELKGEMDALRAGAEKLHWRTIATVALMLFVNLGGTYAIVWSLARNLP
jgi:hypothetical protein